jgi:hypothetical protein
MGRTRPMGRSLQLTKPNLRIYNLTTSRNLKSYTFTGAVLEVQILVFVHLRFVTLSRVIVSITQCFDLIRSSSSRLCTQLLHCNVFLF